MEEQDFEVTITLHNEKITRFTYHDTYEKVEDTVSKMWYSGFLDINPDNPKRKIHILPEEIRRIEIDPVNK